VAIQHPNVSFHKKSQRFSTTIEINESKKINNDFHSHDKPMTNKFIIALQDMEQIKIVFSPPRVEIKSGRNNLINKVIKKRRKFENELIPYAPHSIIPP
jgi:hypothetical protein